MVTIIVLCTHCGSGKLTRSGHAKNGKQKYRCHDFGRSSRERPGSRAYGADLRARVLAACHERCSQRGVCRVFASICFGISRQTLADWLKKAEALPPLEDTLAPPEPGGALEPDELWPSVGRRRRKRWAWLALCRRTRQVVAYAVGGRGQRACRLLWRRVPPAYKGALLYTDFWRAYAKVLPAARHRPTGKGDGQTCHVERLNSVLRQRLGRFVRRALSFSKTDQMHENCLRLFLHEYNRNKLN